MTAPPVVIGRPDVVDDTELLLGIGHGLRSSWLTVWGRATCDGAGMGPSGAARRFSVSQRSIRGRISHGEPAAPFP